VLSAGAFVVPRGLVTPTPVSIVIGSNPGNSCLLFRPGTGSHEPFKSFSRLRCAGDPPWVRTMVGRMLTLGRPALPADDIASGGGVKAIVISPPPKSHSA
jgi:hypothetical protein